MPMQVTKKHHRALNTPIFVAFNCLMWMSRSTWDADCRHTTPTARLVRFNGFLYQKRFQVDIWFCWVAWVLKRQQTFTTHFLTWSIICRFPGCSARQFFWTCFCYKTHNNTQLSLRVCSEMISNKLLLVSIVTMPLFNRQTKVTIHVSIKILHVLTLLLQLHVFKTKRDAEPVNP